MEMNLEKKVKGLKDRKTNTSDASEELQIYILSRLQPEALSRCKCVSKHWNDILTIQAFLLRHSRSYDKHPKLGFVLRYNTPEHIVALSFELNDDNTPKTTIMSATAACRIKVQEVSFSYFLMCHFYYMSNICNGLMCVFNPCLTCVCLLNLKTRDFIRLPGITVKSVEPFRFWYALGFDPVHKVFKVLSINYGSRSRSKKYTTTKAAILTVGSKYWNPIDNESLPSSVFKNQPSWITTECTDSLCFDGVIYWVHKNTINDGTVLTVVAFDLICEAFIDNELVTTPMRDGTFKYYLILLKDCPTLLICKMKYKHAQDVEEWILYNLKDPNAAWNRRNFANHNFPKIVPYHRAYGTTTAGGSALLQYSETINYESWYLFHDLENFAIE